MKSASFFSFADISSRADRMIARQDMGTMINQTVSEVIRAEARKQAIFR